MGKREPVMRHSQLKAFHHVALHGGFSKASRALNVSQPALSEQVRNLEQSYDVLLFVRAHKQITLTETGAKLFVRTQQMFEVENRIEELLTQSRTAVGGTLRIIADSAYHVSEILGRFREKYPKVFVSMRIGNTQEVLHSLRNYGAEIGVIGSQITDPDLQTFDLGVANIIAIASKDFPLPYKGALSLQDLAKLPLVFREQGSKTRQRLMDTASRNHVKMVPTLEIEGREALRDVVASGAGVGFVSEAEFGFDSRLVRIPLRESDLSMYETLICLRQRQDIRVIRAFMDVAKQQVNTVSL